MNPNLKNILIRSGCVVFSLFVYKQVNYQLEANIMGGGWLEDHTTTRYALLMLAAALLIGLNIRKCSSSVKRFVFGGFLLGLSVLLGLWKCGEFGGWSLVPPPLSFYWSYTLNYWTCYAPHPIYSVLIHIWGALSVLLASLLPLFCRAENPRCVKPSKIVLWTAILLFDFAAAMPNVWEYAYIDKCLYVSPEKNLYLLKTDYTCTILYGQDSLKPYYADSTAFLSVNYHCIDKAADLWISESGDSLYFEREVNRYKITRPDGETLETGSAPIGLWESATNCWQWNVWQKIKNLFK